ncbi:MAG: substrate-binding domain-containing protein [bacterium]|nr:substrate-binding domain-containing protein [Candidatus Colisoma equi]
MKKEKVVLLFRSSLFELSGEMMNGVYEYASAHGWHVQMVEHGPALVDQWNRAPGEPVADVVGQSLGFWRPAGCIVEMGTGSVRYQPEMFRDVPTVFLNCSPKDVGRDRLCVYSDSTAIAGCAARELLAFGWKAAAFVPWPARARTWSAERERAFVDVMGKNGCRVQVFECRSEDANEQSYLDELGAWLEGLVLPCAVFAANDLIGRQVLTIAKKIGIDVPRQMAVVAVDNELRICEHTVPTLSSIRQDLHAAGLLAVKLLDDRMRHPRKRLKSIGFGAAELVRRASSSRCAESNVHVLKALEYIRLHACEGISSADVAAQFACSRQFLDRIFRKCVGRSILNEIQRVQVEQVKFILRKEKNLKQDAIASRCGFSSPEDLRRVFKKVEGCTIGQHIGF